MNELEKRFGGRSFGRPTSWQTCTSVVNHEDMDSLFQFLTKWKAHIIHNTAELLPRPTEWKEFLNPKTEMSEYAQKSRQWASLNVEQQEYKKNIFIFSKRKIFYKSSQWASTT